MPLNDEFLSDRKGRIWTPDGSVSAERYDDVRAKYPELALPAREAIRQIESLTDDEWRAWFQPLRWREQL